jgi:CelD/BcsL family acetyltransferase involved in cellulose biosynthesis
MITTRSISDAARFAEMRREWNELLAASSCDCIFLTWEWMHTWWAHRAGDRELRIVTVHDDNLLIAIAPLALRPPRLRRLIPFRVLEFLASDEVGSDYLGFIIRRGHEQDALEGIAGALTSSGVMLELMRVNKTSLSMMSTAIYLAGLGWKSAAVVTNRCPYINLAGLDADAYWSSVHSHHRLDVERKRRKLHRNCEVQLQVAKSEAERRSAMEIFVNVHLTRWSGRGGSTALNSRQLVNFHNAFSRISLDRGWLRMYTLVVDGTAAALLYVFRYRGVHYYYQAALSGGFRRYSVGNLITKLAIDDAIESRAIEFDFLHDDEEYKYLWANQERELIRLELYPPKAASTMYLPVMRARQVVKRLA